MELETIILSEVGQTGKDKYVKSYVWNKKLIQMNLFKDAETDSQDSPILTSFYNLYYIQYLTYYRT